MHNIDFITVSRNPERLRSLSQSIELATQPAFSHKITVIDGNKHDLFNGYNAGAAQTSAEIMIFVHDDVQFLGNALTLGRPLNLLKDLSTGFIGAMGSRILDTTGAWWGGNLTREQTFANCRGMMMHSAENEFGIRSLVWPGGTAEFGQVMVVDGVILMCHRRTFNRLNGFDAATYKGFHFYDVDTTFRANQLGLKNYAAPLPMLHVSMGKYDAAWEKNRAIFAAKYKSVLPCSL